MGTQLKPARDGRWVASAKFRCFQLPAEAGRPAVHAMRWASRFRDVGLNKTRHAPSRKKLCVRAVLLREEGLHKLLIHQLQLLLTVQGGELWWEERGLGVLLILFGEELLHEFLIDGIHFLVAVQGREDFLAVFLDGF